MSINCSVHTEASVLCLHSTPPHTNDPLKLTATYNDTDEAYDLLIKCGKCNLEGGEWRVRVPRYLVGAVAITFHASHEGHPLYFEYLGHKFKSPAYEARSGQSN